MYHLHKFNPNSSSIDPWPQQDLYVVPGISEVMLTNRELKHATFFSHGRQPEMNISQARTLGLSQIFKLIGSTSAET